MTELGFRDRLAYLRWLRNRGRTTPETDDDMAAAWQVGVQWLRKWKLRADAPEGRSEHDAIAGAIGARATKWLYDGVGEPPEPDSWKVWFADWRRVQQEPVGTDPRMFPEAESSRTLAKKAAAKKRRGA